MPKVIVRQGRNADAEYKLEGEKFTMGRRKASDIPVADPKSSRNHAEIFKQGEHYYVRDLASRNGTFLNGERLAGDTQLSFGDKVSIGDTVMEFLGDSAGKPIDFEIPGYQIQERVGEGGMGVVYRARQVSMDRVVALKVLSEKYSANSEFIDRFIREARAAGRLNHPNVIHVHDVSKAGGRYFFSMEFIDGPSVKQLLKEKARLPVRQSLEILTQAAKALEFAHENGIIHRDIKPDNIMLTGEGIVKIADLGIAKSFEEGSLSPDGPGQRKVLGTPHYMAPEQALNKAIDRRADLYSLGATFYHMLTGKTPFTGSTIAELLKAHVHEKLEPIQMLNPEVPEPVCFVVERMMAKVPEKRYENMTRLLEDLVKADADEPADIQRVDPEASSIMPAAEAAKVAALRAQARPRARAAKPMVGLVVMVVALFVVVGVAVGAYFLVREIKERRKRRKPPPIIIRDGPRGPKLTEPERLLKEAREFMAAGKEDLARSRAETVVSSFADSPQAEEAKGIVEGIDKLRASRQAKKIAELVAKAEAVKRDKPADYGEQIKAWQDVILLFPGTPEAERAKTEITAVRAKRDAGEAGRRREGYNAALRKSQAAARQHDYEQAVKILEAFAGLHGGSGEATAAATRAKEIEQHADKLLKAAEAQSAKEFGDDNFTAAIKVFTDLKAQVKSAKWLKDIPAKVDGVKAKIKAAYDADAKLVMDEVKAGKLREATGRARDLGHRFRATVHARPAEALRAGLDGLPRLHKKVLAAIKKLGPRKVTFKMEAALFPGVTWRVTSADSEKLTLSAKKSGMDMDSPLTWAKLSPRDAYNIYTLYLDKPAKEDHRLLAFWCLVRGLAKEAAEHAKKAE